MVEAINGVAEYSVLLPPKKLDGFEDYGERPRRLRLVVRQRMWRAPTTTLEPIIELPILELDMWEVRATLEANADVMQRLVHVLLPDPKGGYIYRVSEQAWQQSKAAGMLPELARQIFQQILAAVTERKPAAPWEKR